MQLSQEEGAHIEHGAEGQLFRLLNLPFAYPCFSPSTTSRLGCTRRISAAERFHLVRGAPRGHRRHPFLPASAVDGLPQEGPGK